MISLARLLGPRLLLRSQVRSLDALLGLLLWLLGPDGRPLNMLLLLLLLRWRCLLNMLLLLWGGLRNTFLPLLRRLLLAALLRLPGSCDGGVC